MPDRRKIVVLLEDDPAAREALTILLADWGYAAIEASDLTGALAKVGGEANEIFAIVTDFNLGPTHNGVDAARALVAAGAPTRVLVISGTMRGKAGTAAKAAGFTYLGKPVRPEDIQEWLDSSSP